MKKNEKSSDELLAELYVSTYKHLHDSTLSTISFYENQYKPTKIQIIFFIAL